MGNDYLKFSMNVLFLKHYNSYLIDYDNFSAWCIEITREQLKEIKDWTYDNLLNQPWVYFLWSREQGIYVWETENLLHRSKEHLKKGHFFEKIYCFTSINDYLNKAHIKVLEYLCYEALKNINCPLLNKVSPTQSRLSEKDKLYCNQFLNLIKRSLFIFNLIDIWKQEDEREALKINQIIQAIEISPLFSFKWKAYIIIEGGKIKLLQGSKVHKCVKKYCKDLKNWEVQKDISLESLASLNLLVVWRKTHDTKCWVDEDWKPLFEYLNL